MNSFVNNIFEKNPAFFNKKALEAFQFQKNNVLVYKSWVNNVFKPERDVSNITNIPFLPISFFKSHKILLKNVNEVKIFESSGTTQSIKSKHYITDLSVYKKSFENTFKYFYGDVKDYCIIGLLPSYLERNNSSLVFMVDELIKQSNNANSGFYLNEFEALVNVLKENELKEIKTLVIAVTFALIEFANKFSFPLKNTLLMETGGMKGRGEELTRKEVHEKIKNSFSVSKVHSEYGMTELLSQAYSLGDGLFSCPPWMKVLVRSEDDPFHIVEHGKGVLNIIDLANINSCCFIATDDVGIVHSNGTFEVHGRLDNSDLRGCNLLVM